MQVSCEQSLTGLPESSVKLSALPFLMAISPSWDKGFWSKNSLMKDCSVRDTTVALVGLMSDIPAAFDKSTITYKANLLSPVMLGACLKA